MFPQPGCAFYILLIVHKIGSGMNEVCIPGSLKVELLTDLVYGHQYSNHKLILITVE